MARSRSRGSAAVEFALVLPVFLLIVFGVVEYGYYFYSTQVAVTAAREGARSGSMTDHTLPGAATTATATATTVAENYMTVSGLAPQGILAEIVPVLPGINGIRVKIEYTFLGLTGYGGLVVPAHVHVASIMRWP